MCGRFVLTEPGDELARLFQALPANDLPETPNYNICPTNSVHVVMSDATAVRRLVSMRWGFLPHWYKAPNGGPLLINARAETIAEKPAFKAACRERRCLIPATGFYEWTKDGDGNRLPWYIHRQDGAPLAFAGVWQLWNTGDETMQTCAIVTTSSQGSMASIHHREPVTLAEADWSLWLGEAGKGAAKVMRSAPDGVLSFHRVDPAVNSNRASGPDLIAPIAA